MKKIIAMISACLVLGNIFSAAAFADEYDNTENAENAASESERSYSIVTTVFPEYDWVRTLTEGTTSEIEITMLFDNGVDPHSYQPTAQDILTISDCDMFIYIGGESDSWVEDALAEAVNSEMRVIRLMDFLEGSLMEEEIVEGMQDGRAGTLVSSDEHNHSHGSGEEDHDHEDEHDGDGDAHDHESEHDDEEEEDHDHESEHLEDGDEHDHEEDGHTHDEHEETEYDEHIWLSVKNAIVLCQTIADELIKLDPDNTIVYEENLDKYLEELYDLDNRYESSVGEAEVDTLLFADRFPFIYLVNDYGLSYYAAFAGCSAETEASFETLIFLIDKMNELSLPCVLTIENPNLRIAETIISNTDSKNQEIHTLNSMQAVTSQEAEQGVSYLSIMEDNLQVLKEALSN